ncbi:Ribose-phosphate pyrophosphokinase [Candidatus Jidaibacter acanthamoeba]|uniref:Ribose-phosphate pyrophosphokinase n=2 Tax=Candidatus Jidaibacter acanthamoebae TaxID=86105 RepID=A0A0C1QQD3_9RICK|nr:Ribose-phosphate pyrophosphokinase [Candidatus Jidaibacter acanthamoeba]
MNSMKLITGNSNLALAKSIAEILNTDLIPASVRYFEDHEIFVELEESIRGEDVYIIQSTSYPANDHIMELIIIIDALRRSSARRITAVIPYYGYSRQDRMTSGRTAISAKVVAEMISKIGADRVLTLDLHSVQIQGFFDIPLDNMFIAPVFIKDIRERYDVKQLAIVSPDVGGVVRARVIAKRLEVPLAIIDKRRESAGVSEVMNIIGDVDKKDCIIIDDIVDSAGTLCNAAKALVKSGANSVAAYVTHGVLSSSAVERIDGSVLSTLVITDSIYDKEKLSRCKKIKVVSIAPLMAEAIKRIANEKSVSGLFI